MLGGRRLVGLAAAISASAALPELAGAADFAVCNWHADFVYSPGVSMTPTSGSLRTSRPGSFSCTGTIDGEQYGPGLGTITINGSYGPSTCLDDPIRGKLEIQLARLVTFHREYTMVSGEFSTSGPLTGYHRGTAVLDHDQHAVTYFGTEVPGDLGLSGGDCFTTPVTTQSVDAVTIVTGPAAAGPQAPSSPPAAAPAACRPRRLPIRISQARGRIVRADVYVDGRRVRTVRGRRVRRVDLARPRAARFELRVVATTARGTTIVTTRMFSGCRASRARVVVHKHRS